MTEGASRRAAEIPTGTVTFLFTDIEGSTELWDNFPLQMRDALARHDEILRSTIEVHNGHVFKTVGDACCATFKDPKDALRAALGAQRALRDEGWGEPIEEIRVRMALHTGNADEEREGDFFGTPLNQVARVLGSAHGGQILLSATTRNLVYGHPELVDEGARLIDLGEYRLKGLRHPMRIYQLSVPDLPERFPPLRADRTPEDFDERYRFVRFLGSGGFARVYLAHDEKLKRDVAVKVLHPQYVDQREFVKRFEQEAQSVAKLSDERNIVTIYDWGQKRDGTHYMVMEYLKGGTLKDLIVREGPLPAPIAVERTLEAAQALGVAHEEGIVHRDIKPQNILLGKRGQAKVADFGIARAVSASTVVASTSLVGTPHYMAPEQALGKPASPRSDLYSLGIVLYEMLTGEVPYEAESPIVLLNKHISERVRSPRETNPSVPERVEAVCVRLMAKDPKQRYPSAEALIKELKGWLRSLDYEQTEPPEPPPPPLSVRVPDLSGKSVLLAREALANEGLKLGEQEEVPSETEPEGEVMRQRPQAGTEVKQGSMVSVTVSTGPSTVEVPDLIGQKLTQARNTLAGANLSLGSRSEAPSQAVPEGEIIGQHPLAKAKAKRGSSVSITISSGPREVSVPDLAGKSVSHARGTLADKGLKLGSKNEAPSDTVSRGRIVEQDPPAGTEVEPNTSVSVTVGFRPDERRRWRAILSAASTTFAGIAGIAWLVAFVLTLDPALSTALGTGGDSLSQFERILSQFERIDSLSPFEVLLSGLGWALFATLIGMVCLYTWLVAIHREWQLYLSGITASTGTGVMFVAVLVLVYNGPIVIVRRDERDIYNDILNGWWSQAVLALSIGFVLLVLGFALLGIMALRTRVLPRWGSLVLIIGSVLLAFLPPLIYVSGLDPATTQGLLSAVFYTFVGGVGDIVLGSVWLALAYALGSKRGEATGAVAMAFAGVAWIVSSILRITLPAYYLYGATTLIVALIGMLGGLVGLHTRQKMGYGWLGLAGFLAAFIGTTLMLAIFVLAEVLNRSIAADSYVLTFVFLPGLLGTPLGLVLLGVATLRARMLPRWCGVVLILASPAALFVFGGNDFGIQLPYSVGIVLGLVWLVLGYELWSQRAVSAGQYPQRRGGLPGIVMAGIFMVALALGSVALFFWVTNPVPDLQGKTVSEAAEIADADFTIVVDYVLPSGQPKGTIIEQSPDPNLRESRGGSYVSVRLSGGQDDKIEVPDVSGMNSVQAASALIDAGFGRPKLDGQEVSVRFDRSGRPEALIESYNPNNVVLPVKTVIATDPPAGEEVDSFTPTDMKTR